MTNAGAIMAEAVARGHPLLPKKHNLDLSSSLFGKLFVLAWAERNGPSKLAGREEVVREFLRAADKAPESIQSIMHVEDRITGPSIAEFTDYMIAAQDDGLLKRYNPAYIRCFVDADAFEASTVLQSFEQKFGPEIHWLRERVEALSEE